MTGKNIKIYFILSTLGLTGGVRVIFEHTNLLAGKGYDVKVVHLLRIKKGLIGWLIAFLKKIKYLSGINSRPDWFALDSRVKVLRVIRLLSLGLSENDIIIATANMTADFVNDFHHDNRRKYYYILDYEQWTREVKLVDKTYDYPLQQIALSENIRKIIEKKTGKRMLGVVPGGVDLEIFKSQKKNHNNHTKILMLYHPHPKKGFSVGLSAMEYIKKSLPEAKLVVFGAYPRPESSLIDDYCFQPSATELARLYRECDIFFYPAFEEGFGLTLLEAAASKCAIATTKVGWTQQLGVDGKNLVFLPKNDPKKMADKIINLAADRQKITALGEAASSLAANFSWNRCNDALEQMIIFNNK